MQEYWITEYGAVADGVTNCAAAIQAAVDAAAHHIDNRYGCAHSRC